MVEEIGDSIRICYSIRCRDIPKRRISLYSMSIFNASDVHIEALREGHGKV